MQSCDRCGDFAPLRRRWEEQWCRACHERRASELDRSLTMGSLLLGTWSVLRASFLPLLAVVLVLQIPLAIIEGLMPA
jgi:hypothetical protein